MTILLTNTYYFPAFDGGAEVSVKLLADGLAGADNKVYVLTTGKSNKVYRVGDVTVISLKQKNIFNSYEKGKVPTVLKIIWHIIDSCNPFYHFKIGAILKRIKPDVVHTNNIQGFSPFLWYTIKSNNIPLIHSMRDYYMLCFKCNMFNGAMQNCQKLCTACSVTHSIKRNFFKYPDFFVGISKFILSKYNAYVDIAGNRSAVIYNALTANKYQLHKDKPDYQRLRFGFIGRIAKDKGVAYMVEEFAKLPKEQKALFTLTFAGKGDESFIDLLKPKLEGIDSEFLGLTKPASFYNNIDVLIVPALWNEPFGRIVIESLSAGVPVCQSDRGGLKELYDPDTSWMFEPESGNLTDMISHIINNKQEVDSKKIKALKGNDRFTEKQHVDGYLTLYNKLLTNHSSINKKSKAGIDPALLLK